MSDQIYIVIEESSDREDTEKIYNSVIEKIDEAFPERDDITVVVRPKLPSFAGLFAFSGFSDVRLEAERIRMIDNLRNAETVRQINDNRDRLMLARLLQERIEPPEPSPVQQHFQKLAEQIAEFNAEVEADRKNHKQPKKISNQPFYLNINGKKNRRR